MKHAILLLMVSLTLPLATGFADEVSDGRTAVESLLALARLRDAGLYANRRALRAHARALQDLPQDQARVQYFQALCDIELGNISEASTLFQDAARELSGDDEFGAAAALWRDAIAHGPEWLSKQPRSALTARIERSLFDANKAERFEASASDNSFDAAAAIFANDLENNVTTAMLKTVRSPRALIVVKEKITDSDYDFTIQLYDPAIYRIELEFAWRDALAGFPKSSVEHSLVRAWGVVLTQRDLLATKSLEELQRPSSDEAFPEFACLQAVVEARAADGETVQPIKHRPTMADSLWQLRALNLNPAGHSNLNLAWADIRRDVQNDSPFSPKFVKPRTRSDIEIVQSRMAFYWEVAWIFRGFRPHRHVAESLEMRLGLARAFAMAQQLSSPLVVSARSPMSPLMHVMNIDVSIRNEDWELWQRHVTARLKTELPAIAILLTDARVVAGDLRLGGVEVANRPEPETAENLLTGAGLSSDMAVADTPEMEATDSELPVSDLPVSSGSVWIWGLVISAGVCTVVIVLLVGRRRTA